MCLGLEGKLCSRFFQLRDGEWKDTGQGKEIVKMVGSEGQGPGGV